MVFEVPGSKAGFLKDNTPRANRRISLYYTFPARRKPFEAKVRFRLSSWFALSDVRGAACIWSQLFIYFKDGR
jgi:hypothetical protein